MRYFIDTEFLEQGANFPIHLLSIGIVAEDDRTYYAVNAECPLELANSFVRKRVIPAIHNELILHPELAKPRSVLRDEVLAFIDQGAGSPEFVVYYGSYDWVVLCQLFGDMANLPKGWPMAPFDIKQWKDMLGVPRLPSQGKGEHHALADAHWTRRSYDYLSERAQYLDRIRNS